MSPTALLVLFLVLTVLVSAWESLLSLLNARHARARATAPPPPHLTGLVDAEHMQRSAAYTVARSRFGHLQRWVDVLVLLGFVAAGGLGHLDRLVGRLELGPHLHGLVFLLALGLAGRLLALPFAAYSRFGIEQRFGFNTMTWGLFVKDLLKGLVLGAVLATPLVLGLFWLMERAGSWWWLWALGFVGGFQLLMVVLYPTVIAPLFSRFSPLEEGPLRDALLALARKEGFATQGIYVMDGSRRSRHSNAFFTGLGRWRRIVLFDTLIEQLTTEQLVGVLAHEIGHWRLRHVRYGVLLSLAGLGVGLWCVSLLIEWPTLFAAFGLDGPSSHGALVLLALWWGPLTAPLSVLGSWWSRRNEYAADAFAARATGAPQDLGDALIALSKDNLSNLTPHPWFAFYHYRHPTLRERLAHLGHERS